MTRILTDRYLTDAYNQALTEGIFDGTFKEFFSDTILCDDKIKRLNPKKREKELLISSQEVAKLMKREVGN